MDFDIVDLKKDDDLSEAEKNDLFTKLIMGKDVTSKVKTSRGEFVIKYPKQGDFESIGRLEAYARGGMPASCFDADASRRMLVLATLQTVIVDGPAWYKNVVAERKNFVWEDIPDYTFCEELYEKVYEFFNEMQQSLEPSTEGKTDSSSSSAAGTDVPVDSGAFSGLAGSTGKSD